MTPELEPSLLTTTSQQREEVSALDRFSVHRCPTRRVFSGIGFEFVTKPVTIRYLYHSATAAPQVTKDLPCREDDVCSVTLIAASVKLTYSASMVDRLTDFCLKVRHEIGVSSIKVMNPPIDTRSSLFVAKSESE
ncbi:uncharacterized protein TNCV_47421 [Trichonephila clavipes]|nr:uncharacterized protein TNCV_47421 [Trichonephila clavipes]